MSMERTSLPLTPYEHDKQDPLRMKESVFQTHLIFLWQLEQTDIYVFTICIYHSNNKGFIFYSGNVIKCK